MRASRLLTILNLLQAHGQATAQTLADKCSVSLRTIYRDVDALAAAGIPIYSERGAEGGYRLLKGYRTLLNGLSAEEADALFLAGLTGPATDMGMSPTMAAAQLKLRAALSEDLRARLDCSAARFHLDLPMWFCTAEKPVHLATIVDAVWTQKAIRVRYQSWKALKQRRIEPLGIVLKGSAWYLIGQVREHYTDEPSDPRTYRISRVLDITVLDEPFERPVNFSLATYWQINTQRLEAEMHPQQARVRISPKGLELLDFFLSPYACAGAVIDNQADSNGWRIVDLPVGPLWQAASDFLRFGAELEVLAPEELRAHMLSTSTRLKQFYS